MNCRIIPIVIKGEMVDRRQEELTIIVCETCRRVVGEIGTGPFDRVLTLLTIRQQHTGHEFVTLYRPFRGQYRERSGVDLKFEYIQ